MADEGKQPGLKIGQVFLSTVAFSHRDDAMSLPAKTEVNLAVKIGVAAHIMEDRTKGLIAMGASTEDDPQALYRLVVEMVGMIEIDAEAPNETIAEYLEKQAPSMMFPFLRETVYNLTMRGRFGPVFLAPINIAALRISIAESLKSMGKGEK